MPYVSINEDVWVDLDLIEDDELKGELEDRGFVVLEGDDDHIDLVELKKYISELHKDYKAYGYTEKFQKLLENFFGDVD